MADEKDNITRLRPKVVSSNDSIEAGIKQTLAEAKGGKYDGAVVLTRHADTKAWSWRGAGNLDAMELIGFLEIVKRDIMDSLAPRTISDG